MGDVVSLRGDPIPASEPVAAFEADPALIRALELAIYRARRGEMLSFIMVYEPHRGASRTIFHTAAAADLSKLMTGLRIEEFMLTEFLASQTKTLSAPPEEEA